MALSENFGNFTPQQQRELVQTKAAYLQNYVTMLMENGGIPFLIDFGGREILVDQKYVRTQLEALHALGFDLYGKERLLDPREAVLDAERIVARNRSGHQPPSSPQSS